MPIPPGFPNATNTGVRSGVTLTVINTDYVVWSGNGGDGAVITGLEVHGQLRVESANVTIRDCKIVYNGGYNAVLIPDIGTNTGCVIEHCTIIGAINGISGTGTFQYNNISETDNGINVYGPSLIQHNYIHGFADNSGEPHYDGVEINGGGGTTIYHNTIINAESQTSAVMLNNEFSPIPSMVVNNNYLVGGAYTIFLDARKDPSHAVANVHITDNIIGSGDFGFFALFDATVEWTGNIDEATWKYINVDNSLGSDAPPLEPVGFSFEPLAYYDIHPGGTVTAWEDLGPNGIDLTPITSNPPTFNSGTGFLGFDGVNDVLASAPFDLSLAGAIGAFARVKMGSNGDEGILVFAPAGGNDNDPAGIILIYPYAPNTFGMYRGSSFSVAAQSGSDIRIGIIHNKTADQTDLYNNSTGASFSTQLTPSDTFSSSGRIVLGSRYEAGAPSKFSQFEIMRLVLTDSPPDAGQLNEIWGFLQNGFSAPSAPVPIAINDSASTSYGTSVMIDVMANDSLGEEPTTVSGHSGSTGGAVISLNDGVFTYTPASGFSGEDSFTYTILDSNGATSSANVTVTVAAPPPPTPEETRIITVRFDTNLINLPS